MPNDHTDFENGENQEPLQYPSEEEWERRLLENEKLMDKYQKVWDENPERRWEDPADLYMKVHHGLDLGETLSGFKDGEAPGSGPANETAEDESPANEEGEEESDLEEEAGGIPSFEKLPTYQAAFQIALAAVDFLKPLRAQSLEEERTFQAFAHHALRIAADIAGGEAFGCSEDSLCGNIVKNRWALEHAETAAKLLEKTLKCRPQTGESAEALKSQLAQVAEQLRHRIVELRAKVWW